MAKKNRKRTHNRKPYHYDAKAAPFDCEYYGIHKSSGRIRIDAKRMKKVCEKGGPEELFSTATKISLIPRSTAYFTPKKKKKLTQSAVTISTPDIALRANCPPISSAMNTPIKEISFAVFIT